MMMKKFGFLRYQCTTRHARTTEGGESYSVTVAVGADDGLLLVLCFSINKRETDNHIIKQPWADCNKPLPLRKHGVRLDYYQEFIAACGGRDSLEGLTTTEVNENFVKPATAHFQLSYCDMLSSQRHAAVGLATVFISHAWKYLILDVVDALLYHFQDEPDIIVWFDLFSTRPWIWISIGGATRSNRP